MTSEPTDIGYKKVELYLYQVDYVITQDDAPKPSKRRRQFHVLAPDVALAGKAAHNFLLMEALDESFPPDSYTDITRIKLILDGILQPILLVEDTPSEPTGTD